MPGCLFTAARVKRRPPREGATAAEEGMPRIAEERFATMAAMKPTQVKESSLREASATPPTIGMSVR